jgi:hypothetical protein
MATQPKNIGEIKQNVKNIHLCPVCKEPIEIGVEFDVLKKIYEDDKFPYPHLYIHGNPVHAALCYIDKQMVIRSIGGIKSIEVCRDHSTFSQLIKKWSNPY